MIQIMLVNTTGHSRSVASMSAIGPHSNMGDEIVWLDLAKPTPDELGEMAAHFQLHPLAVEDALRRRQRPKIDSYDSHLFLVFFGLAEIDNAIVTRELGVFIGTGFLITVHNDDFPEVDEVRRRWAKPEHHFLHPSIGMLTHTVLDSIVDGYFPVLDAIGDRVDDIEEQVFASNGLATDAQAEIFRARRNLVTIRKVLVPERDVMNALVRRDLPYFDDSSVRYLEDVYDHLLRVLDQADTYRDLTSNALDALLSRNANRLNEVMKRMTASSIILMSMALIAGIYGMNFIGIPELTWRAGYEFAILLMLSIGVGLAAFFRKIDYF